MDLYWRDRGRTAASLRYLPWGIAAMGALGAAGDALGYLLRSYGDAYLTAGQTAAAEQQYRAALQIFQDAQDDLGTARITRRSTSFASMVPERRLESC